MFGVGESFTTTITVALYFALIISLPFILYELYGFILPALTPHERRAAVPLLIAVPFLFAAGVLFGYFVVLPSAVRFLVNFNAGEFNVIVQASQFYKFAATTLLAMGLVFQVPIVILGATRLGLVTPRQLRKSRRYALLACAVIAAFLPGDAVTLLLETVPLYLLYEASILLATFVTPADGAADAEGSARADDAGPPAEGRRHHQRRRRGTDRAADHRPRRREPLGLMLFDLRGRHRRRLVKVIYIGLALLIGVGLVGFGVGGGLGGGGLVHRRDEQRRLQRRQLTRARSSSYEKLTAQQPKNVARVGNADQRTCCTKPATNRM